LVIGAMEEVRRMARQRHRRSPAVPLDELEALGYRALCELTPRYDAARGSFAAFANRRVHGAMLNAVGAALSLCGCARELKRIGGATAQPRRLELGPSGTDLEPLEELQLAVLDGVPCYLGDRHHNLVEAEAIEHLQRVEADQAARPFLRELSNKEAVVLERYLWEEATFEELGEQFSICARSAKRLVERLLRRLRKHILAFWFRPGTWVTV
jgi:RNA polymerase sigma factor for flagellar operon FliA